MDTQLQDQLTRIEDNIQRGQIDSVERLTRLDEQVKSLSNRLDAQNDKIDKIDGRVGTLELTQVAHNEKHDSYEDLKLIEMKGTVHHHKMWIAGISSVLLLIVGVLLKLLFFPS